MSENSKIEWTDHTFNPWLGCTKVSPGCQHCYADQYGKRFGVEWGAKAERRRTSVENWKLPLRWNAKSFFQCSCGYRGTNPLENGAVMLDGRPTCPLCMSNCLQRTRPRVFCASLADVFDDAVPVSWRADLFELIRQTPSLDWLLLTKRIGNADAMMTDALPDLEKQGSAIEWPPKNIWLGITVCNQEEADRDIPRLLQTPAAVRFISVEPMLEHIDISYAMPWRLSGEILNRSLDWVIVGGETGHHARPMRQDWVRSLRDQCNRAGVPFFFKGWGSYFPIPTGEKRLLDRVLHDEYPEV